MNQRTSSFDAFWDHFVRSHTKPGTQWMHTAGVAVWCASAAASIARRSPWPFVAGSVVFGTLAVSAHPLFEGNWPENFGRDSAPLYGILGNFRLAWHTLRGTMASEVARVRESGEGSA